MFRQQTWHDVSFEAISHFRFVFLATAQMLESGRKASLPSNLGRDRTEGAAPDGISLESQSTAVAEIAFPDVAQLLPERSMKQVVPNRTATPGKWCSSGRRRRPGQAEVKTVSTPRNHQQRFRVPRPGRQQMATAAAGVRHHRRGIQPGVRRAQANAALTLPLPADRDQPCALLPQQTVH